MKHETLSEIIKENRKKLLKVKGYVAFEEVITTNSVDVNTAKKLFLPPPQALIILIRSQGEKA